MAIGFTPRYSEDFPLNELTPSQFLPIAVHTAQRVGWNIVYIDDTGFIAVTNYGLYNWNAEVRIKIQGETVKLISTSRKRELTDWGRNKKNLDNFKGHFNAVKPAFTEDDLISHWELLQPYLAVSEADLLTHPPIKNQERTLNLFSLFTPVEGYFVTPILLNINILLFIVMVATGVNIMTPDSESLLNWGANYKPMTLGDDWWRLITSCFLHIGILHLLMNMYAFAFIGFLLEPFLGRSRFFVAYMLAGIGASVMSLWWHDATISAGASGAIFGMYGVFLALLSTNMVVKTGRKALLVSIAVFIVYNLLGGLKAGIDNAAHIGGLLCGLFTGYVFTKSLKRPNSLLLKHATICLVSIVILGCSYLIYKSIGG